MKFLVNPIIIFICFSALLAGNVSAHSPGLNSSELNTLSFNLMQDSPATNSQEPDTTLNGEQDTDEIMPDDGELEDLVVSGVPDSAEYLFILVIFTASILLLTIFLHLLFYARFGREFSNSLISIFSGLLLVSFLAFFSESFIDISSDWVEWIEYSWLYGFFVALHLLPYILAKINDIHELKKTIHLVWLVVIPVLISHISPEYYSDYILFASGAMMIIAGYVIIKASGLGRKFLSALATGLIVVVLTSVFVILRENNIIQISEELLTVIISILYTAFPIAFTVYMMNRYGNKYSSFNQKLGEKKSELQKSRNQLKRLHDKLKETQEKLLERDEPEAASEDIKKQSNEGIHHFNTSDQKEERISGDNGTLKINQLISETLQREYNKFQKQFSDLKIELDLALDKNAGVADVNVEDFRKVLRNICHHAFDSIREKVDQEKKRRGLGGKDSYKLLNELPKLSIQTRREDKRIFLKIEFDSVSHPDQVDLRTRNRSKSSGSFTDEILEPALIVANDLLKKHGLEMFILASGDETVIHIELKSAEI
jgi:hypothetical protein